MQYLIITVLFFGWLALMHWWDGKYAAMLKRMGIPYERRF